MALPHHSTATAAEASVAGFLTSTEPEPSLAMPSTTTDPFAAFTDTATEWPPLHAAEYSAARQRTVRLDSGASIISENTETPAAHDIIDSRPSISTACTEGAQLQSASFGGPAMSMSGANRRVSMDSIGDGGGYSGGGHPLQRTSFAASHHQAPRRLSLMPNAEDAAHFAAMSNAASHRIPSHAAAVAAHGATNGLQGAAGAIADGCAFPLPSHAVDAVGPNGRHDAGLDTAPVTASVNTPSPDFGTSTPSPRSTPAVGGHGPNAAAPIKSRNVYVAALPIGFSDEHLHEMMSQFGKVTSARMFNDTRRVESVGRSYGFALFDRPDDAEAAVQGLTGLMMEGRRIQIRLSLNGVVRAPRSKPPDYTTAVGGANSSSQASSPRAAGHSQPPTPSAMTAHASPNALGGGLGPHVAGGYAYATPIMNNGHHQPVPYHASAAAAPGMSPQAFVFASTPTSHTPVHHHHHHHLGWANSGVLPAAASPPALSPPALSPPTGAVYTLMPHVPYPPPPQPSSNAYMMQGLHQPYGPVGVMQPTMPPGMHAPVYMYGGPTTHCGPQQ